MARSASLTNPWPGSASPTRWSAQANALARPLRLRRCYWPLPARCGRSPVPFFGFCASHSLAGRGLPRSRRPSQTTPPDFSAMRLKSPLRPARSNVRQLRSTWKVPLPMLPSGPARGPFGPLAAVAGAPCALARAPRRPTWGSGDGWSLPDQRRCGGRADGLVPLAWEPGVPRLAPSCGRRRASASPAPTKRACAEKAPCQNAPATLASIIGPRFGWLDR